MSAAVTIREPRRGKPSVQVLDLTPRLKDQVVPRSGSCSTEYVRRVSGDELYAFLTQQSCELHDFLQNAGVFHGGQECRDHAD